MFRILRIECEIGIAVQYTYTIHGVYCRAIETAHRIAKVFCVFSLLPLLTQSGPPLPNLVHPPPTNLTLGHSSLLGPGTRTGI